MSRSEDETRREFLLKLARTAALVPPAVVTLDVVPGLAQKAQTSTTTGEGTGVSQSGGKGAVQGQGVAAGQSGASGTGNLSPTSGTEIQSVAPVDLRGTDQAAPWGPGTGSAAPPWSRPPPTQTGR